MGVTISELENVGQIMDRITWFITFLIAGTMAACGDISVGTLIMTLIPKSSEGLLPSFTRTPLFSTSLFALTFVWENIFLRKHSHPPCGFRALIRNVKVLILDEGVSAIDVATANEIEQDLIDMKDLTLLTITHRIKD